MKIPRLQLRQFPLTILLIALVVYLSLFTPPRVTIVEDILGFDKFVHIGMYLFMGMVVWWELLRSRRYQGLPPMIVFLLTWFIPFFIGACMEFAQAYLTANRSGSIWDLVANTVGATLSYLTGRYWLRPWMEAHRARKETRQKSET